MGAGKEGVCANHIRSCVLCFTVAVTGGAYVWVPDRSPRLIRGAGTWAHLHDPTTPGQWNRRFAAERCKFGRLPGYASCHSTFLSKNAATRKKNKENDSHNCPNSRGDDRALSRRQ